jgi:hypothetical protein
MPHPSYCPWISYPNNTGWEAQLWSSSLYSSPHQHMTPLPSVPTIPSICVLPISMWFLSLGFQHSLQSMFSLSACDCSPLGSNIPFNLCSPYQHVTPLPWVPIFPSICVLPISKWLLSLRSQHSLQSVSSPQTDWPSFAPMECLISSCSATNTCLLLSRFIPPAQQSDRYEKCNFSVSCFVLWT